MENMTCIAENIIEQRSHKFQRTILGPRNNSIEQLTYVNYTTLQ